MEIPKCTLVQSGLQQKIPQLNGGDYIYIQCMQSKWPLHTICFVIYPINFILLITVKLISLYHLNQQGLMNEQLHL
jgi:hypothetical protein